MSYRDVTPGAMWQPESAARYNAVNRLLDSPPPAAGGGRTRAVGRENALIVCNASEGTLKGFTPVRITGLRGEPFGLSWLVFNAAKMSGDAAVWGIVREELAPGECGTAVVSGPVAAIIRGTPPPTGDLTAKITAAGELEFASNGTIPVAGVVAANPDGTRLAVIVIGAGESGSGTAEYNGFFKIIDATEVERDPLTGDTTATIHKIAVVDGATLDGTTSGPSLCSHQWTDTARTINGSVAAFTSGELAAVADTTYHVVLEWRFPAQFVTGEGAAAVTGYARIIVTGDGGVPRDSLFCRYRLLGRVIFTAAEDSENGENAGSGEAPELRMRIIQDHTSGAVEFLNSGYHGNLTAAVVKNGAATAGAVVAASFSIDGAPGTCYVRINDKTLPVAGRIFSGLPDGANWVCVVFTPPGDNDPEHPDGVAELMLEADRSAIVPRDDRPYYMLASFKVENGVVTDAGVNMPIGNAASTIPQFWWFTNACSAVAVTGNQ